ncbi:MAG: hypothetical protein IPN59_17510 [Holophaga sp.]|nr:hypothetical protein [Holophaga sp.]
MLRAPMISTLLISFGLVAQTPAPTGPVRLSLQEAIKTSLENNLQVQVAVETKDYTKAGVLISQGAFDWTLNGNASYGYSKSTFENKRFSPVLPPSSGDSKTDSKNLSLGIVKPFEWGGTFSMTYNPTLSIHNHQYHWRDAFQFCHNHALHRNPECQLHPISA